MTKRLTAVRTSAIDDDNVPAILDNETGKIAPFMTEMARDIWLEGILPDHQIVDTLEWAKPYGARPEGADMDTFWGVRPE